MSLSAPPAGPFATHLTLPNRVLGVGACITQPRTCFALSCGTILLCDLSRLAARAFVSPRTYVSGGAPFSRRVAVPILFQHRENRGVLEEALTSCFTSNCCDYSSRIALRHDARRDPPRDVSPAGSERTSSQRFQAAQRNCTHRRARSAWGAVLYTPLRRGCDLSKQIETQEGSRGTRTRSGVEPDMSLEALVRV